MNRIGLIRRLARSRVSCATSRCLSLSSPRADVLWASQVTSNRHQVVCLGRRPCTITSSRYFSSSSDCSQQSHKVSYCQPQAAAQIDSNLVLPPHVDERLSYAYGRSLRELKYCTVGPLIQSMAEREPNSLATVVHDESMSKTFGQLYSDLSRLINGMINELGLSRGDGVALYSYNNYQFVLVQLACNALGLVLNPLNPSYKAHEFSYVLAKSDVKVLFTPGANSRQSHLNNHHSVVCDPSIGKLQHDGAIKNLSHIVTLDGDLRSEDLSLKNIKIHQWKNVFNQTDQLTPEAANMMNQVRSDDLYGVYYTSGTTGFPKGAAITQFNVINNSILSLERWFSQRESQAAPVKPNICLALPLFHEFAGLLGVMLPFVMGGQFVLTGLRYSIQSVVECSIRHQCNSMLVTPTVLIDLLSYAERMNLADQIPIKTFLIAGSKVMPELAHKAHKILPNLEDFRIAYGSSENGVIASLQSPLEPEESRPYSVGPPLDFTEIRIADSNTGETTLLGETGEVQTRGYNTMRGYYNDRDKTDEVITDSRWYRTGDLGVIDKHGSLQIVGRIKDLIIKGGENVYPAEVETVLHKFDLIEDAHVFGVPDKRFGEEVCVWIKLNKSKCASRDHDQLKRDIVDQCKQKLSYFKVPKYIFFVDEFPLTPVKKIKKFEMRAQTSKMLNL